MKLPIQDLPGHSYFVLLFWRVYLKHARIEDTMILVVSWLTENVDFNYLLNQELTVKPHALFREMLCNFENQSRRTEKGENWWQNIRDLLWRHKGGDPGSHLANFENIPVDSLSYLGLRLFYRRRDSSSETPGFSNTTVVLHSSNHIMIMI